MKKINYIIVILLILNSCKPSHSNKHEMTLSDIELELYYEYLVELGIKKLKEYDLLFIYDVFGCNDCTEISEDFIISNCEEFNVLVIRVSGNKDDIFHSSKDIVADDLRLFWKYPFKTHRNHLIDVNSKKIFLIDYVENRDLLCN